MKALSVLKRTLKKRLESLAVEVVNATDLDLTFGEALGFLKRGEKVCRTGWNGKGMYLEEQLPDLGSKMNVPYIYMVTPNEGGDMPYVLVPWLASQTDMLADDWKLVE
jgi:hypothetical protein